MTKTYEIITKCEQLLANKFKEIDEISLYNQRKVLTAFHTNRISQTHLYGSTGYGYNDRGREGLNSLFASIFNCQSAYFSTGIYSGTQAITYALFGVLRPNDIVLSISGQPYDTMTDVIWAKEKGSLSDFSIGFHCIDLINNDFDIKRIKEFLFSNKVKMVYIQRSKGYTARKALTISQIENIISVIKSIDISIIVFVDNCYGEFVEKREPTDVGADLIAGSLIKNMGGGIASTGGYIAGNSHLVELCANRATTPATGVETGSYQAGYREFYQGIFLSPHVVAQALKGAMLFSLSMQELGFIAKPSINDTLSDIVCSIEFGSAKQLISFCQSIQRNSPIDGFVSCQPSYMPGYEHDVIMAAGCFVQGASIELSCDSPVKAPYIAYLQGGLTYEHAKLACIDAIKELTNNENS